MAEDTTGATKTEASLLLTYLAAGSCIGRLIFGRLADCKQLNRFYIWQTGLLGLGVSCTLVTLASSYKWLVVYACVFGLFEGCYVTVNPVLIGDIVGKEKFAFGLGILFFTMSFTRSAGAPIVGWIYDGFHSYYPGFLYTGLVFVMACCIVFLVPLFMEKFKKRVPQECTEEKVKEIELV